MVSVSGEARVIEASLKSFEDMYRTDSSCEHAQRNTIASTATPVMVVPVSSGAVCSELDRVKFGAASLRHFAGVPSTAILIVLQVPRKWALHSSPDY